MDHDKNLTQLCNCFETESCMRIPGCRIFWFARTYVNIFWNNCKILWVWTCYPLPRHETSLHFLSKHFLQSWPANWENWDFFNASAVFQLMEESDTALRSALLSMFITLFSISGCAQIFPFFPVVRLAKSHKVFFLYILPGTWPHLTFLFWALNFTVT